MSHYVVEKIKGGNLVVHADGMYISPNGDLSMFLSSAPPDEPMTLEESLSPTVNVVVASFAAGAWYSAYLIENEVMH